jgi:hypothetical protein
VSKKLKVQNGLQLLPCSSSNLVLTSDIDGNAKWENATISSAESVQLTEDNSNAFFYIPFSKTASGDNQLYTDASTTSLTYNPSLSSVKAEIFDGMATNAEKVKVDMTSENLTHHITFVKGTGNRTVEIDTDLIYNPSLNTLIASTFNGNLSGNASTATTALSATNATNASSVALTSDNTSGTYYVPFSKTSTGNNALFTDDTTGPLTYNPSTSTLTCTNIKANIDATTSPKGYFYYYNTTNFALAAVDTLPINGSNVSGSISYVTELGVAKIVIPTTGYYSFDVYYLVEKGSGGNGDSYINVVINDVVQPLYGRFNRVEHSDNGWSINYRVELNCSANDKVWFNHFHSTSMNLVSKTVNASGITTCPAVQIYVKRLM